MTPVECLEKQLADLDEQMKVLLPTPTVGTVVQWFNRAIMSPDNAKAALVTAIEEPGRVKVTIFSPNGMPTHKQGVYHASHAIHKIAGNAATVNNGAWDYRPDDRAGKHSTHWNLHRDQLQKRKDNVQREIENIWNAEFKKDEDAKKELAASK